MSKSVYITGIAGFIGSTLAKKLHSEGYEVSGIDNLSFSDGSNLEGTDIVWEVGDFSDVSNIRADTIIHLAAITCARYDNEYEMAKQNYANTVTLIQKFQNKRIIILGSSNIKY
jgi:nucleoside-diphosphate-sugar epimerase